MYKICGDLYKIRKDEGTELGKMEKGTEDIIEDWTKILEWLYGLSEQLKVPRKAKCKLHFQIRRCPRSVPTSFRQTN